jgi:cell division protein FtsQ
VQLTQSIRASRLGLPARGARGTGSGNRRKAGPREKRDLKSLFRASAWMGGIMLGMVFFVALSVAMLFVYRWVTSSDFFALKRVEVQGIERLEYDQVIALSELKAGLNCLGLNMSEMEERLLAEPWIEKVSVKRLLPDAYRITVTERRPEFLIRREGKLYYADVQGRVIAPVEAGKFTPLPHLTLGAESEEMIAVLPELDKLLAQGGVSLKLRDAAWIRLDPGGGIDVGLDEPGLRLSLGWPAWRENAARLQQVLDDLQQRGELKGTRSVKAHGSHVWVSGKG